MHMCAHGQCACDPRHVRMRTPTPCAYIRIRMRLIWTGLAAVALAHSIIQFYMTGVPMLQDASARLGAIRQDTPTFDTERFIVAPLTPAKVRELIGVLLMDENLARQVPWMEDKTADGALREAFLLWAAVNRRVETVLGPASAEKLRGLADKVASQEFLDAYTAGKRLVAHAEATSET